MKQPHSETIFLTGDDYFESLLNDIAQARTQIDLETYIFRKDALGERVLIALVEAANRGVQVRILVDGAGISPNNLFKNEYRKAGIQVHIFHPLFWRFWHWQYAKIKLSLIRKLFFLARRANFRNHRKVCLIDKKIVYIGSANIDKCHLSIQNGGGSWRDTVVKLVGVDTEDLENAFERAWEPLALKERFQQMFESADRHAVIRLNYTRHRRRMLYKNLLRTIKKSHQRIWITNAYFIPDNNLLLTLIAAAQRNVDVRILLPQKSDVPLMTWGSATFYQRLLKAGVRIFEYTPSMLHAKTCIIDDWFLVGSSNLNHRSLLHDLEADVCIGGPDSKQLLEEQFLKDIEQSKEITWDGWKKRGWFQRAVGRLVLYLKYWI